MEKVENDEDQKHVIPVEKQYADFTCAPIPIAEDGGPIQQLGDVAPSTPIPALTLENFRCMDGPCRHYWHLVTLGPDGGTELKQHSHTCLINTGMETDFTDECVFECSRHERISWRERWRRRKNTRRAK